jgi:hypothetical protein
MAKRKKCSICNSIHADKVNDMLTRGVPYTVIVAYLKDRNFKTSKMTISRHKRFCLDTREPAKEVEKARKRGQGRKKKLPAEIIQHARHPHAPDAASQKQKTAYVEAVAAMEEEVDVLSEMLMLLRLSRERLGRAVVEEQTIGQVLPTTGSAIKEHAVLLDKFRQFMEGLDTIKQARYSELVQLVNLILCAPEISDRSRAEFLALIESPERREEILAIVEAEKAHDSAGKGKEK